MASHGTSGEEGGMATSTPMGSSLSELSVDQLQTLRKDQLSALLAAFVRHSGSISETSNKPLWELENFASSPGEAEAPLRFLIWREQAEQWLQDHEHLPVAVQARVRGALKGGAVTEYHRLQNGIAAREDLASPYGLLNVLSSSFVPGDTKEKAINRLHKWVFNKNDVLGSARHFLDDLRLAGIRAYADKDYWAEIFLSGFPLDIQARLSRNGKATVADYYSRLHGLIAEQTYRWERCRLTSEEAALTLEQIGGGPKKTPNVSENHSKRGTEQPVPTNQSNGYSQRPWCRYHQFYGHSTGTCEELNKQARKLNKKLGELINEAEKKKGAGSANFRPSPGTR